MEHMVLHGPTLEFPLTLLPLDFRSLGILLKIAIMQEKHQNNLFEI